MNKTHIYPKRLGYSHLYQAHTHIYIQWRNAHLVSYCAWSERQIYQCAHTDSIQFMGLFKPLYASLSILSSSYYHGWGLLHTCSHVGATYPSAVLCSVNSVNKSNGTSSTHVAALFNHMVQPYWMIHTRSYGCYVCREPDITIANWFTCMYQFNHACLLIPKLEIAQIITMKISFF